jgi:hypothetical protein
MSHPRQQCKLCGTTVIVKPDGRGFPPDIAKNKLKKLCKADGCPCEPQYTAGIAFGPRARGMNANNP